MAGAHVVKISKHKAGFWLSICSVLIGAGILTSIYNFPGKLAPLKDRRMDESHAQEAQKVPAHGPTQSDKSPLNKPASISTDPVVAARKAQAEQLIRTDFARVLSTLNLSSEQRDLLEKHIVDRYLVSYDGNEAATSGGNATSADIEYAIKQGEKLVDDEIRSEFGDQISLFVVNIVENRRYIRLIQTKFDPVLQKKGVPLFDNQILPLALAYAEPIHRTPVAERIAPGFQPAEKDVLRNAQGILSPAQLLAFDEALSSRRAQLQR